MAVTTFEQCFKYESFQNVDDFQTIIDKLREQVNELEKRDEIYDKSTFSVGGTLVPLKEKVNLIKNEVNSVAAEFMQARKKLMIAFLTKAINDLDELIAYLDGVLSQSKSGYDKQNQGNLSDLSQNDRIVIKAAHDRYVDALSEKKRAVEERDRLERMRTNLS